MLYEVKTQWLYIGATNCLLQNGSASSSSSTSNPVNSDTSSRSSGSHTNVGAIVGGVVGGVVVLAIFLAAVFLLRRNRKKSKSASGPALDPFYASPPMSSVTPGNHSRTPLSIGATSGRSQLDLSRNPYKSPTSATDTTPIQESSADPDDSEPIYHRDAGRVEVPPSYENAREN
jgi:hypothetical protein